MDYSSTLNYLQNLLGNKQSMQGSEFGQNLGLEQQELAQQGQEFNTTASNQMQQFQQQLQYTANTDAIKFATVLDPWNTGASVKITSNGGVTTVEVTGSGYDDTWTWNDPKDNQTASAIDGKRGGAALIALSEADKAPTN